MRRVFISYHHGNEQDAKQNILDLNRAHKIFLDCSVDTGDIDENLEPQQIRQTIRRKYLSESTVLLLIIGKETRFRKHVDWELYSSMYNGPKFGSSGVVVLHASDFESNYYTVPFEKEVQEVLYPGASWTRIDKIDKRGEYERRYPHLPPRIIDNLVKGGSKISVTNWSKVINSPENLRLLIECAHNSRTSCKYDMTRPMRMRDHNP